MALSRREFFTLVGVALTAVLTILGHFLIREWYSPSLGYQAGDFYRSAGSAITSLRLENYGAEAATDVEVSVAFPTELRDVSVSPGVRFSVRSGGVGSRTALLNLDRIAPDQSLFLYFAAEDPEGPLTPQFDRFLSSVVYSDGLAVEGQPLRASASEISWSIIATVVAAVLGLLSTRFSLRYITPYIRRPENERLRKALGSVGDFVLGDAMPTGEVSPEVSRYLKRAMIDVEVLGEVTSAVTDLLDRDKEVPAEILTALQTYRPKLQKFEAEAKNDEKTEGDSA